MWYIDDEASEEHDFDIPNEEIDPEKKWFEIRLEAMD